MRPTATGEASVPLLEAPGLAALPGVRHGFTTRRGGVSAGALASLNLARRPGERDAHLVENWRRVAGALTPGWGAGRVALLHQVHGNTVEHVDAPGGALEVVAEADGAVTSRPGVVLAVRTADCVPVLLAAPGAVGVAHAGWRGLAAGVVPATVRALCELAGVEAATVRAAVGPHISGAAYEVGDEVVQSLREAGIGEEHFRLERPGARDHVDLGAAASAQLRAAGVVRVDQVGGCTHGDPRFWSHRRDGSASGRQAGVIARVT